MPLDPKTLDCMVTEAEDHAKMQIREYEKWMRIPLEENINAAAEAYLKFAEMLKTELLKKKGGIDIQKIYMKINDLNSFKALYVVPKTDLLDGKDVKAYGKKKALEKLAGELNLDYAFMAKPINKILLQIDGYRLIYKNKR
jgi:hypothetical protein